MRRIMNLILATIIFVSLVPFNTSAQDNPPVTTGTKATEIDENLIKSKGCKIVDNESRDISYTWAYNLNWKVENDKAYGGNVLHNAGQVGSTISYDFAGNYIAVAFCETYHAAKILIYIDDVLVAEHTPFANDKNLAVIPGESKIIYVNDSLENTNHTLLIKHEKAYVSGEENVKEDGNAYYDNDAYFDFIIVRDTETEVKEEEPEEIVLGASIKGYTDEVLGKLGYKAIYSNNEDIIYTWPFDLPHANHLANNREYRFNLGQVSATLTCDFEGTYLAVVFGECYYAAKVVVDVDGEIIGEFTPHTDKIKVSDTVYQSKIFLIKDDLKPGNHTVTISLETAYTTGEDNVKPDGKAYYDNDSFFDCFIVQKNPTPKEETPTPVTTKTPQPTETASYTENPETSDKNSGIFAYVILAAIAILVLLAIIIFAKRRQHEKV